MPLVILALTSLLAFGCDGDGDGSLDGGQDASTDGSVPCAAGCRDVCDGGSSRCECPQACTSDEQCAVDEACDPCAYSSCAACDDCLSGCVPHGCPTETEPLCDSTRPDCGSGGTAIVRDGCWQCVMSGTCLDCSAPCMAATAPECGGIEGRSCPTDFECIDDPRDDCDPAAGGADCAGVCAPNPGGGPECGGIAGLGCAPQEECIDDTRDDCDPAAGGADCAGLCVDAMP